MEAAPRAHSQPLALLWKDMVQAHRSDSSLASGSNLAN